MTLDYQISLAEWMVKANPDVTIGQFAAEIVRVDGPRMISSDEPLFIPKKQFFPKRVIVEPVVDKPAPFTRPAAKYDNRSQEDIYNQYAPIK